jgi:hypothetical protein
MEKKDKIKKPVAKPKKEKPLKLNMSFDEAIDLALKTPVTEKAARKK